MGSSQASVDRSALSKVPAYVDLDPSWKFKDYQQGIELPADLFIGDSATSDGIDRGLFEEIKYLSKTVVLDGSRAERFRIVSDTPLEFFEGEVQQWLTENHPGKSLADVPYDGPIVAPITTVLPVGLAPGMSETDVATHGTYGQIVADPLKAEQLTTRFRIALLGPKQPEAVWSHFSVLAEAGLSSFVIENIENGSDVTSTLLRDGVQVTNATISDLRTEDYFLPTAEVFAPGVAVPPGPVVPTTVGLNAVGIPYILKHIPNDQILSIAIDAGQYSVAHEDVLTSALIDAVSDAGPGLDDLDELVTLTTASYIRRNRDARNSAASLTRSIPVHDIGMVMASVPRKLAEDANGPIDASFSTFGLVPHNFTFDSAELSQTIVSRGSNSILGELNELLVWQQSALQQEVVGSVMAIETASTVRQLQKAFAGQDLVAFNGPNLEQTTNDSFLVELEAFVASNDKLQIHIKNYHASDFSDISYFPTAPNVDVGLWFEVNIPMSQIDSSNISQIRGAIRGIIFSELYDGNAAFGARSNIKNELGTYIALGLTVDNSGEAHYDTTRVLVQSPMIKSGGAISASFIGQHVEKGYVREIHDLLDEIEDAFTFVSSGSSTIQTLDGFKGSNYSFEIEFEFPPATVGAARLNVADGSVQKTVSDIAFPNAGVALDFSRKYNSRSQRDIGLGVGWTHSFGDRLILAPENQSANLDNPDLIWLTAQGVEHRFDFNNGGSFSDPGYQVPYELIGEFTKFGSSSFVFKTRDGFEVHFETANLTGTNDRDPIARLLKKVDLNGNGFEVTYASDTSDVILSVADVHTPDRRLAFAYGSGQQLQSILQFADGSTVHVGQWDFHYENISSSNYLTRVDYPDDGELASVPVVRRYRYYRHDFGDSIALEGLLKEATEPNGDRTSYDYYPNRRLFRMTDGDGSQTTHSYDPVQGKTFVRDARGNEEAYSFNENGLLTRQIHADRTRNTTQWGEPYTLNCGTTVSCLISIGQARKRAQFLKSAFIDEVGAVERFQYYTALHLALTERFKDRELKQSQSKRFEDRSGDLVPGTQDAVTTEYDYAEPSPNIVQVSRIAIDPSGENRETILTYDPLGRLKSTTNAVGDTTEFAYLSTTGADNGLLASMTSPRGTNHDGKPDNEAVTWEPLDDAFVVLSGTTTLSVTLEIDSTGSNVAADATRLDLLNAQGAIERTIIIDDSELADAAAALPGAPFQLVGSGFTKTTSLASAYPKYGGDSTSLTQNGSKAIWTFEGLEAGTYRVSTSWDAENVRTDATYRIFAGSIDGSPEAIRTVAQSTAPTGFNAFMTEYTYDSAGLVTTTRVADTFNGTTTYHHTGSPETVTDGTGRTTEFRYDVLGRLKQSVASGAPGTADDLATTFFYDANGQLLISTDPLGRVTESVYDERGNVLRSTYADATVADFEYDDVGNLVSTTDQLGRKSQLIYDNRNRLIQTIFPDGESNRIRYDGVGRISETYDSLNRISKTTHDAAGRVTEFIAALGLGDEIIVHDKYDAIGNLIETIDAGGNVTQFFHDKLGRVTKSMVLNAIDAQNVDPNTYERTMPSARPVYVETIGFDPNGNVTETIVYDTHDDTVVGNDNLSVPTLLSPSLRDGLDANLDGIPDQNGTAYLVTSQLFDHLDRPTRMTYADGTHSLLEYDAANRPRFAENERGARTLNVYDEYGRLSQTIFPDPVTGLPGDAQSPVSEYTYDKASKLVSSLDANQHQTTFGYDSLNRLTSVTDAVGSTTSTIYDRAGQVVASIDAANIAFATKYDKRGRVERQTWVDPDGAGGVSPAFVTQHYDAIGNLTRSVDARGNITNFVYDDLNRLKELQRQRTGLDATDQIVSLVDGITRYGYDNNGNLTSVTDPRNFVTEFAYDELNRVAKETLPDPDGSGPLSRLVYESVYDGYNNLIKSTEEANGFPDREDIFEYDSRNRLVVEVFNQSTPQTNADRVRNEYEYDAAGNLITLVEAKDSVVASNVVFTRYEYDLLDRLTFERLDAPADGDAGRHSIEYQYDLVGNVVLDTYTVRENVVSTATDRSVVNSYTYDDVNRLRTVVADVGGIESTSKMFYSTVGEVVKEIDPTNIAVDYQYDDLYRLTKMTLADPTPMDGNRSELTESYAYDIADNLVASKNGEQEETRYEYNSFGQMLFERIVMDPAVSTDDIVTRYQYDEQGNPTSVMDPNGSVTKYEYDGLNRIAKEIRGNLATPEMTRSYQYNNEGNLELTVDRNGRVIRYSYDGLNRLVKEEWFQNESNEATNTVDNTLIWVFDKLGRITVEGSSYTERPSAVSLDRYVQSFEYDALGRVTTQRNYLPSGFTTDANAMSLSLPGVRYNPWLDQQFDYEVFSTLNPGEYTSHEYTQILEPVDGSGPSLDTNLVYAQTQFVTDKLGRLSRMTETPQPTNVAAKEVLFNYDPAGRMNEVTRRADDTDNGSITEATDFFFSTAYDYDPSGRLDSIRHTRGNSASTFSTYAYDAYDNASRITNVTSNTELDDLRFGRQETFAYDAAGRLTDWTYDLDDQNEAFGARDLDSADSFTLSLDSAGNRINAGYIVDGHNRIDADPNFDYEYDNEGNLVTRRLSGGGAVVNTYVWDHRNRLIRVEDVQSGRKTEFGYNNNDLRVRKTIYTGIGNIERIEHFVYDGRQLSAVIDGAWQNGNGTPDEIQTIGHYQRRVQNGPGVDTPLFDEVFHDWSFSTEQSFVANEILWAATDHAGSVRDVLSNSEAVANHFEYDAFGKILLAIDPLKRDIGPGNPDTDYDELAIDAAFAGREWDSEAGLYYNRARWYDAAQLRFISEDPIGFAGGDSNLYRYANGDPANARDPSGLYADGFSGSGALVDWEAAFRAQEHFAFSQNFFAFEIPSDLSQELFFESDAWSFGPNIDFESAFSAQESFEFSTGRESASHKSIQRGGAVQDVPSGIFGQTTYMLGAISGSFVDQAQEIGSAIAQAPGAILDGSAGRALGDQAVTFAERTTGQPFTGSPKQIVDALAFSVNELLGVNAIVQAVTDREVTSGKKLNADLFERGRTLSFAMAGAATSAAGGPGVVLSTATKATGVAKLATFIPASTKNLLKRSGNIAQDSLQSSAPQGVASTEIEI